MDGIVIGMGNFAVEVPAWILVTFGFALFSIGVGWMVKLIKPQKPVYAIGAGLATFSVLMLMVVS